MVADEHNLHVIVFCTQEAHHPEVEATSNILLEFSHTPRNVHHSYHHSIRLILNRRLPHLKAQIFGLNILELSITLSSITLQILHNGAFLIQISQWTLFCAHR